jgi:uncharacterized protein (DUF736 family)
VNDARKSENTPRTSAYPRRSRDRQEAHDDREASGKNTVSRSLAAPEFGPRKLTADLGRTAGNMEGDSFAVIWNPTG